jgi:hypothetical protein
MTMPEAQMTFVEDAEDQVQASDVRTDGDAMPALSPPLKGDDLRVARRPSTTALAFVAPLRPIRTVTASFTHGESVASAARGE